MPDLEGMTVDLRGSRLWVGIVFPLPFCFLLVVAFDPEPEGRVFLALWRDFSRGGGKLCLDMALLESFRGFSRWGGKLCLDLGILESVRDFSR